jgi:hypothetical protein
MGGITLNLPKVVPSFTFTTPAFLLSFAFLTRNGRHNPEFSEIFYLPLLTSTPTPFFLLFFWKEMGMGNPQYSKSRTLFYLPASPSPQLHSFF